MATAADIVTGILVTELTADDDLINNIMNNEKRLMLKRFFFNKQKRKKNMGYVTMNTLIRISLKKKKLALMRRRKFKAKAQDADSSLDHDYAEVAVSRFNVDFSTLKDHFGIERKTFDRIVEILAPKIGTHEKLAISVERKVLIGIWALSTQDSFRQIADKFEIPKSSAYYAFVQLIGALHGLASTYITWPEDAEKEVIAEEFTQSFNFPGVFGVINSYQIPVKISTVDDTNTTSANTNESRVESCSTVALQAVCDHKMKFTDIHIGSPQPSHAITCTWKFFEGSGLGQKLCSNELTVPSHLYLLGDGTYPLKTYLLAPYKEESLSEQKKLFNTIHKNARTVSNRAFAFLLNKFQRLDVVDTSRYDLVPQIITAACVLQNIILEESLEELNEECFKFVKKNDVEHVHPCPQADHDIEKDAIEKRDSVAEKLKPLLIPETLNSLLIPETLNPLPIPETFNPLPIPETLNPSPIPETEPEIKAEPDH